MSPKLRKISPLVSPEQYQKFVEILNYKKWTQRSQLEEWIDNEHKKLFPTENK